MATSRAETLEVIYEDDDEGAVSSDGELEEDDEDDDARTSLHGHPDHIHVAPPRLQGARIGEGKGDKSDSKERARTLRAENKKLRAHLAVLAREVGRADTEMDRWRARCRRIEEERDALRRELDRVGLGNRRSIATSSPNIKDGVREGVLVYSTTFDSRLAEHNQDSNSGEFAQPLMSPHLTSSRPLPVLPAPDVHHNHRSGEKDIFNTDRESVLYTTDSTLPAKLDYATANDGSLSHIWPANLTPLSTRAVEKAATSFSPSRSGFMFESAYPNPNGHGEKEIGWEPVTLGVEGFAPDNQNPPRTASPPSVVDSRIMGVGFSIPSHTKSGLGHISPSSTIRSPSTSVQSIQPPRRKSSENLARSRAIEPTRSMESIGLSRSGSTSSAQSVSLSRAGSLSRGSDSVSRSDSVSSMSSNSHSHSQAPRSRPQSHHSQSHPTSQSNPPQPQSNHFHVILPNRTSSESLCALNVTLRDSSSPDNLRQDINLNSKGKDVEPITSILAVQPGVETQNNSGDENLTINTVERDSSGVHIVDSISTYPDSNHPLSNSPPGSGLRDSNDAPNPTQDHSWHVAMSHSRFLGAGVGVRTDPGSSSIDNSVSIGPTGGHENPVFLSANVNGRPPASTDSCGSAVVSALTNQLSASTSVLNSGHTSSQPWVSSNTEGSQINGGRGIRSVVQFTSNNTPASLPNSNVATSLPFSNSVAPYSHPNVAVNATCLGASVTNIGALPSSINVGGRSPGFTSNGHGNGLLLVNRSQGSALNGDGYFVSNANTYSVTSPITPFSPNPRPFSPNATPFSPAGSGFSDASFSHRVHAPNMTFPGSLTTFAPTPPTGISPYQSPLGTPLLQDDPEYGPVIVHGPLPPRHMQYGQYQTSGVSISNTPAMRRKREPASVPPRHLGLAGGGVGHATWGKGGGGGGYESNLGDSGSYNWRDR